MSRTPAQDVANCRAFAQQLRHSTVARVLNDAADQIERLSEALRKIAKNDLDGLHEYTPQAMQEIARAVVETQTRPASLKALSKREGEA